MITVVQVDQMALEASIKMASTALRKAADIVIYREEVFRPS